MHDHECDDCHYFNFDEECIMEESLLDASCEEIEHEVPAFRLELVEYMSPDQFTLIPASLVYNPFLPICMSY